MSFKLTEEQTEGCRLLLIVECELLVLDEKSRLYKTAYHTLVRDHRMLYVRIASESNKQMLFSSIRTPGLLNQFPKVEFFGIGSSQILKAEASDTNHVLLNELGKWSLLMNCYMCSCTYNYGKRNSYFGFYFW